VNSCLYEGSVRHRRHGIPDDEFHYSMFMVYLDLDELPGCLDARILSSARHPALAWFRRSDHLGDPRTPLPQAVRELVLQRTGIAPEGPIRLLTHLRCFGHCFNPVSFYYCFDRTGEHVRTVVAHVTNTPWGESHSYVMPVSRASDHGSATLLRASSRKRLHVSPLMGMQHTYEWRASEPAEQLLVHIESRTSGGEGSEGGERVFDATLSLRRRELSSGQLARSLARYPFLTLRILARIYGHALRLRVRGASYFPHPAKGTLAA
jgi:DUF1365 family protein